MSDKNNSSESKTAIFSQIFTYFEKFVQFSANEKEQFASLLELKKYEKAHTLTKIGDIEKHLYFIESGIIRGYCAKKDEDITCMFGFSNTFISAYSSFTEQSPSAIELETLTDVTLYRMKYHNLQMLYSISKEGEKMGRMAAEQMSASMEKRFINMLTKSALERYKELLNNEPHLLLTIPQMYVAEYLGVKPESLSRIKKQLMLQS